MADPVIPPRAQRSAKVAVGAGIAAAMALAAPIVGQWEGKRNDPYLDIVKVPTVCYGETRVEMRHYSDAECSAMLHRALADDYAAPIARCIPQIADRPRPLAAMTSLAYNIGVASACKSTAAQRFRARDITGGCKAIGRFVFAGGRKVQGLVNRRAAEVRLCLGA